MFKLLVMLFINKIIIMVIIIMIITIIIIEKGLQFKTISIPSLSFDFLTSAFKRFYNFSRQQHFLFMAFAISYKKFVICLGYNKG